MLFVFSFVCLGKLPSHRDYRGISLKRAWHKADISKGRAVILTLMKGRY